MRWRGHNVLTGQRGRGAYLGEDASTSTETTTSSTSTSTSTETTTSSTSTSTSTETTTSSTSTTTTPTHIASDEELCNWAVKDYAEKTGVTPENAEIEYTADGNAVITLTDAEGNVLDVYNIDPFTGEEVKKKKRK